MRREPPPGTPPHDVPQRFLLAMRTRTWEWWRPLVGLFLFLVGYALLATVVLLVQMISQAASGASIDDLLDPSLLMDFTDPGNEPATEAYPGGLGLLFLLISLLSMGAYVALVARSRRRLRPEPCTASQDWRGPFPVAATPAA